MRLPYPTRIPIFPAFVYASVLVLVQLIEGTDPVFSALCFSFVMISVLAFNTAGGLSRPSGAYILFYALLVVIVGITYKAFRGEAAQTNLQRPLMVMGAYVLSITAMLAAAFLARRLATTRDGMADFLNVRSVNYTESALGCVILYFFVRNAGAYLPGGGGQLLVTLNVLNPFLPLSILLGTIAAVRNSGGERSTNTLNLLTMGYATFMGMLLFSKQGMFTPVACWLLGAAWSRFRLRLVHIVFLLSFGVVAQMIFVPLASVRDEVTSGTFDDRFALLTHALTHVHELRQRTNDPNGGPAYDPEMYYYNGLQGLWDRLTMMPNDSVLMRFSAEGHYFGYKAVQYYFENWVPHFIDPHKLEGISVGGNAYMHEMGMLSENDYTTGISFSPTAEAFHIDGWRALILIAPAVWFLLFVTSDAVCGDTRRQPWGLITIIAFAHAAPEGGLAAAIWDTWAGNIAVILAIVTCGYVTPLIGLVLSGRKTSLDTVAIPRAAPGAFNARPAQA